METPTGKPKQPNNPNNLMRFSGLGLQMVITMCLAAWGGLKLDSYFNLKVPVFLIVLLLTALGGSMYIFIRQVTKSSKF